MDRGCNLGLQNLSMLYLRTIKCWKLIDDRDIGWGCDHDMAFDLAVVALTFKILFGLYLGNYKVQKVDT